MSGVECLRLNKAFGHKPVLRDLSLSLWPGDRVALVGQNGSGKTTLIRCLLGFYNFGGEINIFDMEQRSERENILKRVAFVPQSPPPLKSTVGEMCEQLRDHFDISTENLYETAEALDLDLRALARKPFKKLSGGMKQKLLIVLALVRNPDFLIMDEPAANLDPLSRAKFYSLLDRLAENTIFLMSSHRVDEVSHLVNRVIELDEGHVVIDDVMRTQSSGELYFELNFREVPETVKKNLHSWGFSIGDTTLAGTEFWCGRVAAANKFRFLGTLTRWSGMIQRLTMSEISERKK